MRLTEIFLAMVLSTVIHVRSPHLDVDKSLAWCEVLRRVIRPSR